MLAIQRLAGIRLASRAALQSRGFRSTARIAEEVSHSKHNSISISTQLKNNLPAAILLLTPKFDSTQNTQCSMLAP